MKLYEVFLLNEGKRERLQMLERTMEFADEMNLRIIDRQMSEINQNFDREDVKIWLTRILRAEVLSRILDNSRNSLGRASPELSKYVQKIISNSELESRIITNQLSLFIGTLEQASHFLSLPINEIQEYRFSSYELPSEIFREFEEIEREWQENIKDLIPYNNESVIMDFGDGFAWYDLENAACDAEAGAMGHCGNAPSADNPNETIFSLRERKEIGGNIYVKPYLTFIFNTQTRMFGEMKGRANEKPAERYHQYIIPLIMEDWVEGLQGGGYMPESNFKITDVSGWERFVQEKPQLIQIKEYVQHVGVDDYVKQNINFDYGFSSDNGESVSIDEGPSTRIQLYLSSMRGYIDDNDDLREDIFNQLSPRMSYLVEKSMRYSPEEAQKVIDLAEEKYEKTFYSSDSLFHFIKNEGILDDILNDIKYGIVDEIYEEIEENVVETMSDTGSYHVSFMATNNLQDEYTFDTDFHDVVTIDLTDDYRVVATIPKKVLINDLVKNDFEFEHNDQVELQLDEIVFEPETDFEDILDDVVDKFLLDKPEDIVNIVYKALKGSRI